MKKEVIIGVGVLGVAAAVAFYLYNKNKSATSSLVQSSGGSQAQLPASSSTIPTPATAAVKQTMWKDIDGNIFEMTSNKSTWGYYIKVNGSTPKKNNMMEVMVLGPDGYVVGADNNGSLFVWKNGGWNQLIKDNKTSAGDYLKKLGVSNYLSGFAGLGMPNSAFVLS